MSNSSEAELLKLHFEDMLVRWGSNTPVRTTLHASAVLVPEAEWCVREHVLMNLFPEQVVKETPMQWDWKKYAIFENGWRLHQRWQDVFERFGKVVTDIDGWGNLELDHTHYDETRNVYFSPDAIIEFAGQRYVVEIKGIKQEVFLELTDNLEMAIEVSEVVAKARIQANLYMHLLGLKRAILLIENKNNQEFKVWVIEYDKDLALPYALRMYEVKGHVALARRKLSIQTEGLDPLRTLHVFPQRICSSRTDARARKCPMRDCCFSEEREGGIDGTEHPCFATRSI